MVRFQLAVSMAAFVLLGLTPAARSAEPKAEPAKVEHSEHDAMLMGCAKVCSDCQRMCDMCVTHCSHMLAEGKKDHAKTLATCLDCSTICSAASQVVARGGPFSHVICAACAECCAKCAKACETHPDDKHMKMCAEECRKCEKACAEMVKHMGGK